MRHDRDRPRPAALRHSLRAAERDGFDEYLAIWRFAEEVGLDWASVFDHFQPIQSDPTGPCFEGLTLLAAMAAHTTHLRCGIIVSGVTYRNPALLAKIAATIDHVSGGRMELGHRRGVAPGRARAVRHPVPADRRANGHARRGLPDPARSCGPSRARPSRASTTASATRCASPSRCRTPMPLWIGGAGEKRTLRIVAEHATGWNTFFGDPGRVPAQARRARRATATTSAATRLRSASRS